MIRALDQLLYSAKVGPATLVAITSVMSDKDKAKWLWKFSSWPRPNITHNGLIRVPDPAGGECLIDHQSDSWGDTYTCDRHGACWATFQAERAYRVNSGLNYEASTGDSFHSIRMVEPLD